MPPKLSVRTSSQTGVRVHGTSKLSVRLAMPTNRMDASCRQRCFRISSICCVAWGLFMLFRSFGLPHLPSIWGSERRGLADMDMPECFIDVRTSAGLSLTAPRCADQITRPCRYEDECIYRQQPTERTHPGAGLAAIHQATRCSSVPMQSLHTHPTCETNNDRHPSEGANRTILTPAQLCQQLVRLQRYSRTGVAIDYASIGYANSHEQQRAMWTLGHSGVCYHKERLCGNSTIIGLSNLDETFISPMSGPLILDNPERNTCKHQHR